MVTSAGSILSRQRTVSSFATNEVIALKKILVWSLIFCIGLIFGIGLMICVCGPQLVAEPESAKAATGEETETTAEVTEGATETTATAQTTEAAIETTQATEAAKETTQTTVPETTAVSQVKDWRTAYLEFLDEEDCFRAFALVYIDGDSIPELYLNGIDEATGDAICAYKNGQVIAMWLRRTWGGSYIPGTGLIKNTNGNMGYYTTHIYRLTGSGFTEIWSGYEEQKDIPSGNGEWTVVSTFSIDERTVSEAEYYAAIEAVFNTSQAVPLHLNAVSYDAIRQQILGR